MTDTNIPELIINKLTRAQYESITPDPTQLYFITDEETYIPANPTIVGNTKCKITYDSKGLVTAGADLSASDIPNLTLSKISDVTASATELNYCDGVTSNIQAQLNSKLSEVPQATSSSLGGIIASEKTATETQEVKIDSATGKLYVQPGGGGGSVEVDNKTINKNTDDEIQTIAVIDQNNTSNGIKTWTGTKAQYDAIATKDANTIYNVTDETVSTARTISTYQPILLQPIWMDHQIDRLDWAEADSFSWKDGELYTLAYNELLSEYNNASSTTVTEGSIVFKRTPKGYKITTASYESAVASKYSSDGRAWYYILDTANTRFKLPRTKYGLEGLRTNAGDDIAESLPNIRGYFGRTFVANNSSNNQVSFTSSAKGTFNWNTSTATDITADVSLNASIGNTTYQNGAPVQERATQMYLYFYVGQQSTPVLENIAAAKLRALETKANASLDNLSDGLVNTVCTTAATTISSASLAKPAVVKENYRNGTSWYRVWSDGMIEQFGQTSATTTSGTLVSLVKSYTSTSTFQVQVSPVNGAAYGTTGYGAIVVSANSFRVYSNDNSVRPAWWYACGY